MLSGEKSNGQIAKQYGVHPNSFGVWKKQFLERGSEISAQENTAHEYARRLAELEQLLGKKEVDLKVGQNPLADDSKGGPQHHPLAH